MSRHVPDILCWAGLAAFAVGLWLVWPPLALLGGGAGLVLLGVALRERRKKEPRSG